MPTASRSPATLLPAKSAELCGPRVRRLGKLGLFVYNLLYWPYLLGSCVLLFGGALALFLLTFWDRKRRLLNAYTRLWGGHYLSCAPFAGVSIEGEEQLAGIERCVYVINHQSMVDILAVFALNRPFLWVSKRSNFFVPFLGWNMALNRYVALRRGHLPSILRMLRSCLSRVAEGHSLCVFPEGTRSPDGQLLQFFRGAFWVACRTGVPVVPVVVHGTREILPKRKLQIKPRPVRICLLPPLRPEAFGQDSFRMREAAREAMSLKLDELARTRL